MNIPADLKYTKEHEWVRVDGDTATIGISDYAQGELGDIVFIEFPAIGDATKQFQSCASIEAVKAVTDLYAPVSGEIVEVICDHRTVKHSEAALTFLLIVPVCRLGQFAVIVFP